jgi:energy-coupling factor transport system substrate-specific component
VTTRSRVLLAVITVIGLAAFLWPFAISATGPEAADHAADAPFVFAILVPLLLAVLVSEVSSGDLDAKAIAYMGVLAAAGTALRVAGAGISGFEAAFFLLIPAGRVFGRSFGFVLGCVTILVSGLLTGGMGPWLPFQMMGAAWIGFGAGCLPRLGKGHREIWLLAAYGVVVGRLYGLLLNLWFWPWVTGLDGATYLAEASAGENLSRYLAFYSATSLGWDIPRAITNATLMVLAGGPLLRALRRSARRGSFGVQGHFGAAR